MHLYKVELHALGSGALLESTAVAVWWQRASLDQSFLRHRVLRLNTGCSGWVQGAQAGYRMLRHPADAGRAASCMQCLHSVPCSESIYPLPILCCRGDNPVPEVLAASGIGWRGCELCADGKLRGAAQVDPAFG